MPLRNSPTNIPGKLEKTMWNEYIIIVERKVHSKRNLARQVSLFSKEGFK